MGLGKKMPEEIIVDDTAWILDNGFAEFVLMHTNEIKYMCMLGYTFMHGCKIFGYFEPTDSTAYKFVSLCFACTGGGILVPIFLNQLPVTIAMDSYPIAITTSFFLHSMFPVLRDVVKYSPIFKVALIFLYEIFRTFVVSKFTYVAASVIPASEFEIAIFGPIICGAISGCGGAFLPMSKGLNPIKKDGLAPPMFSALIGATFFHLAVHYGKHMEIPHIKDKARVLLAIWFIGHALYSNGLLTFGASKPAAGKTKKEYKANKGCYLLVDDNHHNCMLVVAMIRLSQGRGFLSILLLMLAGFAHGQPPGSKLTIKSPKRLVAEVNHRESLFGQPPYGASIEQKVYYVEEDLCGSASQVNTSVWEPPFILMVSRGGCTFVQKVRNAQILGAAAAIIADNSCLCSDDKCNYESICETAEPIMADDGSGADIMIPSMLIFKSDADPLIQELKNGTEIEMEMSYNLPSPDGRVEYDFFTVPNEALSKKVLDSWKPMAKALGTKAFFTPHMYIYDGIRTNCVSDDGQSLCYNLCTNRGRYCATDPDNDLERGISGADVVTESLRRICIWKLYGAADGIGEKWWDYVKVFGDRCSEADYFTNDDCIRAVYAYVGVDGVSVDRCIKDSGGLDDNRPNSLLDGALTAQSEMGVIVIPTLYVNKVALRGTLSSEALFGAICSGFAEGSSPDICTTCAGCQWDLSTCAACNECVPDCGESATVSNVDLGMNAGSNGNNQSFGGTSENGNNIGGGSFSNDNPSDLNGGGITGENNIGGFTFGGGDASSENFGNPNGGGIISGNGASGIGGDSSTGQQEDGWSQWEPDNQAHGSNADESILDALYMLSGILESLGGTEICGLNLEEIEAEASNVGNTDLLGSIHLDEQCNSSQEQEFLGTLEKFESCAGWDIKEVIETLPSAIVGTSMRCVMKAMAISDKEAFEDTIVTECAEIVLGDNPLGNALKRFLLEPSKNCGCLGDLSELPACELDVWPIPIFGSGLKTWSCLLTTLGCGFLPNLCDSELAAISACLKEESNDDTLCKTAASCYDSVLLSLPAPLAGMPIPDACRQAHGASSIAVARYESYVNLCVKDTGLWDMHEPSSNYAGQTSPSDALSVPEGETTSAPVEEEQELLEEGKAEVLDAEAIEAEKDVEGEQNLIRSPSSMQEETTISTSTSASSSGFLIGLIMGCLATSMVAMAAVFYFNKKSSNRSNGPAGAGNDQKGKYTSIELT